MLTWNTQAEAELVKIIPSKEAVIWGHWHCEFGDLGDTPVIGNQWNTVGVKGDSFRNYSGEHNRQINSACK